MLREIKVYGELAKFVGQKLFQAEIGTAAEAIRFLVANFPRSGSTHGGSPLQGNCRPRLVGHG